MSPATLPPYLTAEFIKDVLIAICKDADEVPTKEGVEWLTGIAKQSPPDALYLRRARLGPTSTLQLAKRLEGVDLPTVDLFENAVKDVGFMALAKFAERHFALKRLNCGSCGLTSDAAISLADVLRYNCGLEAVELGIPTGYIFQAAGQRYRDSAYTNYITEQGIVYLARSLSYNTHLKYLGLSGSHIGYREGASALGRLLATNATLTALDVSFCDLRDAGAAALLGGLAGNATLYILRLSGNGITFLAVPHLAAALAAHGCPICELFLDQNPLGPEGARALARGIVSNTSLTRLSVSDCSLTDNGAALICAAVAGAGKTTVELQGELADVSWAVSDEIIDSFMRNMAERAKDDTEAAMTDDTLHDKKIIIVNHKGRIVSATRLRKTPAREYRAGHRLYSADDVSEHVSPLQSAYNLRLEDIINYAGFDELSPPEEHEEAYPQDDVSFAGEEVAENKYFETNQLYTRVDAIDSSRADDFHSASATHGSAVGVSQITHLSVGGNGVGARTVRCVCALLSRGCLRHLDLQRNRLDDSGVILLAETLVGHQLRLRDFKTRLVEFNPDIYKVTSANTALTNLSLRKCGVCDAGFAAICVAFSTLPNALSLDLRDNYVGERGGRKGVFYLCRSSAILSCRLDGNQIDHASRLSLERHLTANKQRVTMNAPKRLRAKISDIRQQVERLSISREEMTFLNASATLLRHYLALIQQQRTELEEQSARYVSNLRARYEQYQAYTAAIERQIGESRSKYAQLAVTAELQAQNSAATLLEAQSAHENAVNTLEALRSSVERGKTDSATRKQQSAALIATSAADSDAYRAMAAHAKEMTARLSEKYQALCKKALTSQVPIKLSIYYDYEQLAPTVTRIEKILAGAKQIPQIKLYDCATLDFALPKRPRSTKSARSKKARK